MRTKVDFRTGSKENYQAFIKEHPSYEKEVSFNKYLNILYAFNEEFRTFLLETGDKARLPANMGEFVIVKKKRKKIITDNNGVEYINLPIDWKKTIIKGKYIYNFNHHTNGYFFGYVWNKKLARFKFSTLWFFKTNRSTARILKHYLTVDDKYQHLYKEWTFREL